MKHSIIVLAIALAAAGACLAQSDSTMTKTDTTAIDKGSQTIISADTGKVQNGGRNTADKTSKWAVGCAIKTIENNEFDGMVFIEKWPKYWLSYTLALQYKCQDYPAVQENYFYSWHDSSIYNGTNKWQSGSLAILPGISISEKYKPYRASLGLQAMLQYNSTKYQRDGSYSWHNNVSVVKELSRTQEYTLGVEMPFTIERIFQFGKKQLSIGLQYKLVEGGYSWYRMRREWVYNDPTTTHQYNDVYRDGWWRWNYYLFEEPILQFKLYF